MLVAVVSDSHNNHRAIEEVRKYIENADILLFLGDGEEDLKELTKDFNGEVYAVKGNCDITNRNPNELILEVLGKKIFMCHGHRYNVKYDYNTIYYKGREIEADIVLFGHSHIGIIEKINSLMLMNPGSISHGTGMCRRSLGFIEIVEGREIIAYLKELRNSYLQK